METHLHLPTPRLIQHSPYADPPTTSVRNVLVTDAHTRPTPGTPLTTPHSASRIYPGPHKTRRVAYLNLSPAGHNHRFVPDFSQCFGTSPGQIYSAPNTLVRPLSPPLILPSPFPILPHACLCDFVPYHDAAYHLSRSAADLRNIYCHGPIEDCLCLDPHLPDTASDTLRLHHVRQYDRVIPSSLLARHQPAAPASANASAPAPLPHRYQYTSSSCTSPGYRLTDSSLSSNAVPDYDPMHFAYTCNVIGDLVA